MSEHNELSYNERLEEIARLETELKGLRDLENLRVLAIKSLQVENKALRSNSLKYRLKAIEEKEIK